MKQELYLEYQVGNKTARVMKRNDQFEVDFFDNNEQMGTINYADKSLHFVEDAAENWVTGVMSTDTLNKYSIT
jgi:hypothetical protein|tara:strand:+ start:40416 stop:40634 length:219 start_codon:yes stop_codon:yes gene_type:complete